MSKKIASPVPIDMRAAVPYISLWLVGYFFFQPTPRH
jgi:hypothetical protein